MAFRDRSHNNQDALQAFSMMSQAQSPVAQPPAVNPPIGGGLNYAQLLGMTGGNQQGASIMQNALGGGNVGAQLLGATPAKLPGAKLPGADFQGFAPTGTVPNAFAAYRALAAGQPLPPPAPASTPGFQGFAPTGSVPEAFAAYRALAAAAPPVQQYQPQMPAPVQAPASASIPAPAPAPTANLNYNPINPVPGGPPRLANGALDVPEAVRMSSQYQFDPTGTMWYTNNLGQIIYPYGGVNDG